MQTHNPSGQRAQGGGGMHTPAGPSWNSVGHTPSPCLLGPRFERGSIGAGWRRRKPSGGRRRVEGLNGRTGYRRLPGRAGDWQLKRRSGCRQSAGRGSSGAGMSEQSPTPYKPSSGCCGLCTSMGGGIASVEPWPRFTYSLGMLVSGDRPAARDEAPHRDLRKPLSRWLMIKVTVHGGTRSGRQPGKGRGVG